MFCLIVRKVQSIAMGKPQSVRWLVTFASIGREQRDGCWAQWLSPLYSVQDPSPWNGAATFRVGLLTSI